MKRQSIELMNNIRNDAYRLGYIEGEEEGSKECTKQYVILQNELFASQKRAAWLQNKLIRTKENYEGQVCNLQKKIEYYEELLHRGEHGYKDHYTDMKGE